MEHETIQASGPLFLQRPHLHHTNTHFKPTGARHTGGIAGILEQQVR